jgi:hypothetical protein
MNELGADTETVLQFIEKIKTGQPFMSSVDSQKVNQETINFMSYTFEIIQRGNPHEIAAVFTFGREDLIPDMFIEIVKGMENKEGVSTSRLIYYLERHIEIDGGEHGPLSLQMIDELCGDDAVKWEEATYVSSQALKMRINLWNGILKQIDKK